MSSLGLETMSIAGIRTIEAFAIIGMIHVSILVLKFLSKICRLIWVYKISTIWKTDLKKYGEWAVVTGSTDGIGKAYAIELAKRGINLILISRSQEKLEKVSQEIGSEHKVQVEIIQADFSNGRQIYEPIANALASKNIGILVNNVGVMAGPNKFEKITEDEIWNQATVNIASVPAMIKLVLPGMLQNKKGLIVNFASMAALCPLPKMQIYAASKVFITNFSIALENELQGTGVDVQTVLPGMVKTNMLEQIYGESEKIKEGLIAPSAQTYAEQCVSTVGYAKETAGYWVHEIQNMYARLIPQDLMVFILGKTIKPPNEDVKKQFLE